MFYDDLPHTYEPIGPDPVGHALMRLLIIVGATVIFWSVIVGVGVIFFG